MNKPMSFGSCSPNDSARSDPLPTASPLDKSPSEVSLQVLNSFAAPGLKKVTTCRFSRPGVSAN